MFSRNQATKNWRATITWCLQELVLSRPCWGGQAPVAAVQLLKVADAVLHQSIKLVVYLLPALLLLRLIVKTSGIDRLRDLKESVFHSFSALCPSRYHTELILLQSITLFAATDLFIHNKLIERGALLTAADSKCIKLLLFLQKVFVFVDFAFHLVGQVGLPTLVPNLPWCLFVPHCLLPHCCRAELLHCTRKAALQHPN